MNKSKILFTGVHRPKRSPSQRYRIEQFLPYLQKSGFEYDYTYIIDSKTDSYFYKSGNYLKKGLFFVLSLLNRWIETFKFNTYDFIFVQREALLSGTYFYERKASKSKAKLIFDFDDAIWMQHISDGNKKLAFLKDPEKTKKIIQLADLVLAGNTFLQNYALQYNSNSVCFPTVVDTEKYKPIEKHNNSVICIGWSGSFSTFEHFEILIPVLDRLHKKYNNSIKIKVLGAPPKNMPLPIEFINWSEENEVVELSEFDIGVMPLNQTPWNEGKCGLKSLLYLSMGIPAVVSSVGVSSEIIQNGLNGFVPQNEEQWFETLCLLIENKNIREKIGSEGRKTVISKYSVLSQQEKLVQLLRTTNKR